MLANPRPLRVGEEINAVTGAGATARQPAFSRQGLGGKHLQPRVTGADGGRPETAERPGRWGATGAGKAPGAERQVRGLAAPSGPAPTVPTSAAHPPPHPRQKGRLTCSATSDSAARAPGSGDSRVERITATAAKRCRQSRHDSPVVIASRELRSFPVAGPPLLRHPSHVTGSAGSAHAEGRGLRLGAGPVRGDWHPRNQAESAEHRMSKVKAATRKVTRTVAWIPQIVALRFSASINVLMTHSSFLCALYYYGQQHLKT